MESSTPLFLEHAFGEIHLRVFPQGRSLRKKSCWSYC